MSAAAAATTRIGFGPLLETPQVRPPAVAAGSVATLFDVSDGRAMLTYGVGDTAVRFQGQRPSTVAELEAATDMARRLLLGEEIDVGTARPASLSIARPAPVWIAASGPKTLRMAGRVADGVFLRVGTHPANIEHAVALVRAGAADAARSAGEVSIGLIVHTITSSAPAEIAAISRCMAAGFYEYAPALFDPPGFDWPGPPIHELQQKVWPDFHHTSDFARAGELVAHLPDDIAASFSFHGDAQNIADQITAVAAVVPELSIVVPHPVPFPRRPSLRRFARWIGDELKPLVVSA